MLTWKSSASGGGAAAISGAGAKDVRACIEARRWQGVDARGVMGDSDVRCDLRVLMPGVFRRAAAAAACCAACTSSASSAAAAARPSGCSMAIACAHAASVRRKPQLAARRGSSQTEEVPGTRLHLCLGALQ